ncbi:OTU domain-containing protein 3 [Galdieria sulphuraria]|uniref:OTU-like cysteine protease family protein n=1 Tax=Galdieria sulphuraria TaxID=130081 RepID=M2Y0Y6_GALSU|nr:OTU-like cysteine protease family protein [Galdieria sulphuraria]EME29593.1 OTU-like cysteine protease family protein [Galdieria sulphuraria]GJD12813.1 OTU domain-containing protein 3 [Galdieria sulphuraria]|eukprot:XP_005706113.1 OTU-like cysteine protease family protein [Galdieria sulphuraria]
METNLREKRRSEHTLLRLRRKEVANIDQDIKNFRKALFCQGLDIRPVKDDGNCLFRAAADQIVGNERFHAQVREQVCDYIALHGDYLKDFVEDNNTLEEYLSEMRIEGTWAGNIELQAISLLYGVNIRVHRLDQPGYDLENFKEKNAVWIHLAFHQGEHYSSVRRLKDVYSNAPAKHCEISASRRASVAKELAKETKTSVEQALIVLNTVDGDEDRSLDYLSLISKNSRSSEEKRHLEKLNRVERKELKRLKRLFGKTRLGYHSDPEYSITSTLAI